jgi:hypothetical protein
MDQKASFVCNSFTSPGGKTEERGKQNLTISADEKTVDEKLSIKICRYKFVDEKLSAKKPFFFNLLHLSIKSVLKNLA